MLRLSLWVNLSLLLIGCGSLPYQKLVVASSPYGYEEKVIDKSTFLVSYHGKKGTPTDVFRAYLARRATELCEGDFKISEISEKISVASHRKPGTLPLIKGKVQCF
ncbi:MAG: hypothetical protein OQJ89_13910 [Kangiellaceae bacterium]|nr:hypothetical protein [Kangiellaceae bacterium]MCW9018061.1 hypothetical protein [Kangiellaceae bacterium]